MGGLGCDQKAKRCLDPHCLGGRDSPRLGEKQINGKTETKSSRVRLREKEKQKGKQKV